MAFNLRFLMNSTLGLAAISLAACSSLSQDGKVATDMTGSFSHMWSNLFTGELRRAPQPEYVFGGSDATLNTPQLLRRLNQVQNQSQQAQVENYWGDQDTRLSLQNTETRKISPENPWLRRGLAGHSLESYESYRPQLMASLPAPENILPSRPAQSQPVYADPALPRDAYPIQSKAPAPAISQDWQTAHQEIGESLSYVKIGGGSQIADWQNCETQAGGYFVTTGSGFNLMPEFDSCMRRLGYKPEAEAEIELAGGAG